MKHSALRRAIEQGNLHAVRVAIAHGADIDAPNAQGSGGPIRMALKGQHPDVIDLLIAHGAALPEDVSLPRADNGERRKRKERRLRNAGPPRGLPERRVQPDRRMTSVREIELDEAQWENYFAQSRPDPAPIPFPTLHDPAEHASLVLDRARD